MQIAELQAGVGTSQGNVSLQAKATLHALTPKVPFGHIVPTIPSLWKILE